MRRTTAPLAGIGRSSLGRWRWSSSSSPASASSLRPADQRAAGRDVERQAARGGESAVTGTNVTGRIAGARSSRGRRRGRAVAEVEGDRVLARLAALAGDHRQLALGAVAAAVDRGLDRGARGGGASARASAPPSSTSVACVGCVAATVAGSGAKASTISATRSRTRRDIVRGAALAISPVDSARPAGLDRSAPRAPGSRSAWPPLRPAAARRAPRPPRARVRDRRASGARCPRCAASGSSIPTASATRPTLSASPAATTARRSSTCPASTGRSCGSRAASGCPKPLPDVLGLAVRILDAHGPRRHQDFLLVTSVDVPVLHHLILPGPLGIYGQSYSSVLPYRIGDRLALVGALPRRPDFELAVAPLGGRWARRAACASASASRTRRRRRCASTRGTRGGGIRPTGPFQGSATPAYRGSQSGRDREPEREGRAPRRDRRRTSTRTSRCDARDLQRGDEPRARGGEPGRRRRLRRRGARGGGGQAGAAVRRQRGPAARRACSPRRGWSARRSSSRTSSRRARRRTATRARRGPPLPAVAPSRSSR